MPANHLVFVVGEVQRNGSQEQVMRSFGGKYVGEARASRLRLLLIDLPKAGVLPLCTPYSEFSVQLPGAQAIGSVWQISETALTRLDAYFGFSGGFTRSLTSRDLMGAQIVSVEGTEVQNDNYTVGMQVSIQTYILGDTLKAYLMFTGIGRVLLGHGDWFRFKRGVEKTGKEVVVAPPVGEFAGKLGGELVTAVSAGLVQSVTYAGEAAEQAQASRTIEEQLGF